MATWTYRGLTTKKLYRFMVSQGLPETLIVINGENCVQVNNDGSVQRGVAGGPPAGAFTDTHASPTVFDTYDSPSRWEQS